MTLYEKKIDFDIRMPVGPTIMMQVKAHGAAVQMLLCVILVLCMVVAGAARGDHVLRCPRLLFAGLELLSCSWISCACVPFLVFLFFPVF